MFVVLGLGPLGLLTYFAVHLSGNAVVQAVKARVRTTAAVSALLVQQEMQGVAELTASYAGRWGSSLSSTGWRRSSDLPVGWLEPRQSTC